VMEESLPDCKRIIRADIFSTTCTGFSSRQFLEILFTVVSVINNIDFSRDDLTARNTDVPNFLEVFFTNWLILEGEVSFS